MKKICVVGLGYIGLPTSVMFSNYGFNVHGVDVNPSTVKSLSEGRVHIIEPGIEERLEKAIENSTFTVSTKPEKAEVFIIAVPTPINEDKSADLSYVVSATESIVPYLKSGDLVILESTVPPRTVKDIMLPILKKANLILGEELFVSHSPEKVIPGKVIKELVENDRIVGGINQESAIRTSDLYKTFVKGDIHLTDETTAELVKVMENTYRDVNIAFANEMAKISDNIGVNVWEAIEFANYHPRVNIHYPGPGVGGHCIAVDPWFLVEKQPQLANIIKLSRNTNDSMPQYTVKKVVDILQANNLKSGKVGVLGLAFKANIDDMRGSPSIDVIKHLRAESVEFLAYDPYAKKMELPEQVESIEEVFANADLLLILTDHKDFKNFDPVKLRKNVKANIIFDTKNCLNRVDWEANNFNFYKLGDSKEY